MRNYAESEAIPMTDDQKLVAIAQTEGCLLEDLTIPPEILREMVMQSSPQRVGCVNCNQQFDAEFADGIDLQTGEPWEEEVLED